MVLEKREALVVGILTFTVVFSLVSAWAAVKTLDTGRTVITDQSQEDTSQNQELSSIYHKMAQSFKPTMKTLTNVSINLYRETVAADRDVEVAVFNATASSDGTAVPGSDENMSAFVSISASSIGQGSSNKAWKMFTLPEPINLVIGRTYWIVVRLTPDDCGGSVKYQMSQSSANGYANGLSKYSTGSCTSFLGTLVDRDLAFRTHVYQPLITVDSPQNVSYINYTWFNVTLISDADWCGFSYDDGTNVTMTSTNATHFYYNQTDMAATQHTALFWCNFSSGIGNQSSESIRYFSVDSSTPEYENASTYRTSPATYGPGTNHGFQIFARDDFLQFGSVKLSLYNGSWVNYTASNKTVIANATWLPYHANITGLEVDNYTYMWYVSDGLHWNSTGNYTEYNVTRATPYSSLMLNGSVSNRNYEWGSTINLTSYASDTLIGTAIYGNFSGSWTSLTANVTGQNTYLYHTTALATGAYLVGANTAGNKNYYDNATNFNLTISIVDTQGPNMTFTSPLQQSYGSSSVWVNATTDENASWCIVSFNRGLNQTMSNTSRIAWFHNQTSASEGNHSVVVYCNDTSNNFGRNATWFISDFTAPNVSNVYVSPESPAGYSLTELRSFNMTCQDMGIVNTTILSIGGRNYTLTYLGANASLSPVGKIYGTSVTGLGVENHTYYFYVNDSLGNSNTTQTFFYNITKAAPTTYLWLNDSQTSVSVDYGQTANITTSANDPAVETTIYTNFSGSVAPLTSATQGQNSYYKNTAALSIGTYVISANATGNANYTSNETLITYYLNVRDLEKPSSSAVSVSPSSALEYSTTYYFMSNWTDNYGMGSALLSENATGSYQNHTVTNISGSTYTYALTYANLQGVRTLGWRFYGIDNSSNLNTNQTSLYQLQVRAKTSASLSATPSSVSIDNMTVDGYNFTVNVNATDNGGSTMYYANLSMGLASGWYANASYATCNNVSSGASCFKTFVIHVPSSAGVGSLSFFAYANWTDPDHTSNSTTTPVTVTISENKNMAITETSVATEMNHSSTAIIGNFSVNATGNAMVSDVTINTTGGNLSSSWITFVNRFNQPYSGGINYTSIAYASSERVYVNITVPAGQAPGSYWTNITAYSDGVFRDWLYLNVTVPQDISWSLDKTQTTNTTIEYGSSGTLDTIVLSNTGNIDRKWTFGLSGTGYQILSLSPSLSSGITVAKSATGTITIGYNTGSTTPGYYQANLTITNLSSSPTSRIVTIPFTILNLPPTMSSIQASPFNVETSAQTNISADVIDASGIHYVWVTIRLPNSSVANYSMNSPVSPSITYVKAFTPYSQGTYSYQIYSNDTNGETNSTPVGYFYANPATSVTVTPVPLSITLSNITSLAGNSTVVNITLSNTGNVTAYYLNLSLTVSGNISANSTYLGFNNLSSSGTNSSTYLITVAAGTPAATYTVPLTAMWINPNGTAWTNTTTLNIFVQQNPQINMTHGLNFTAAQSSLSTGNLTVYSFGNHQAPSVTLSCANCSGVSVSFSPSSATIAANSTQQMQMNVTVPNGQSAGAYTLPIYANGTGVSAVTNVPLYVQQNMSWTMSPNNLSYISGKDNSGTLGYITITNYGNVDLNFSINVSGDTQYIGTAVPYQSVSAQSTAQVAVNFTSSLVGNYTVNVTVSNSSASPSSMNTTINLSVLNFNMTVSAVSPSTNISSGDTLRIVAAAFLEGSPLSQNITWTAAVNGTSCPVTYYANIANEIWAVNCTAPSVADGKNYTLRLTANYTTRSAAVFDEKDITYADVSAPSLPGYSYTEVRQNQSANLSLNVTDNVMVDNATATISYPNGTIQSVGVSRGSQTFLINFTGTADLGEYKVAIAANDTVNNTNSSMEAYFAVYTPVTITGMVKDALGSAVTANFSFFRPRSGLLSAYMTSNSSGSYSGTVNSTGNMTINVTAFGSMVVFRDANVTYNAQNAFALDSIPTEEISGNVLEAMFVNTSLNYTNVTLTFDYTGTSYNNEDYIGIYKCSSWDFTLRSCNSTWSRQSGTTKNKLNNIIQITSSSLSAYAVAEYICGDGTCHSGYGESCSVCPSDCGACSTGNNQGSTGGGGGGGGGGGSGSGTTINGTVTQPELQSSLSKSSFRLKKGESEVIFLKLENKLGYDTEAELSVSNISKYVTLDKTTLELLKDSKESVGLTVFVPDDATPGTYNGDILVKYGNRTDRLPISLVVVVQGKKITLSLSILNKEVSKDESLKFRVIMTNIGEDINYPVRLEYLIKELASDRTLYMEEENVTMDERITLVKNISLANLTVKSNELSLDVKAYYGPKMEEAVDTFVVVHWLLKDIFSLDLWRLLLGSGILLFGSIPVYYTYTLRRRVVEKRKRYRIEIDFDKLPVRGSAVAFAGKIAEADKKAYIDLDSLTTHVMVAGATGSGKTIASQVIAEEALLKGKNVIIFDPSAQWTGFLRKCKESEMLSLYKDFGMKEEDAKAFSGTIKIVRDPLEVVDMKTMITAKEPRVTIFVLNMLKPEEIDLFIANTVNSVFAARLPESKPLKALVVYDEVHRLLPKFGGSGKGFIQVERGAREFRKWGIGMVLVSQVLSDFVGEIRANIGMEVQMRTRYEEDLNRLARKYGESVSRSIVKAKVGTGLFEFSEYNNGKPYFVSFRPLLHQVTRLSDKELEQYDSQNKRLEECKFQLEELSRKKVDVFDIEVELKLADQKLAQGAFDMAGMYLESIEGRVAAEWKRLGMKQPKMEERLADEEKLKQAMEDAKKERMKYQSKIEPKQSGSIAKVESLYEELKSLVDQCKKRGAETFVEEIELERVPSNIEMLKMKQESKEIKEYTEKLESMRNALKEKLDAVGKA